MDFIFIGVVVSAVVVAWVLLVRRSQRQASADELAGWSPRSKRRRRRRRSEPERED